MNFNVKHKYILYRTQITLITISMALQAVPHLPVLTPMPQSAGYVKCQWPTWVTGSATTTTLKQAAVEHSPRQPAMYPWSPRKCEDQRDFLVKENSESLAKMFSEI